MPCSVVSFTFFDVLGTRPLPWPDVSRRGRSAGCSPSADSEPRGLGTVTSAADPAVIGRSVIVREEASAEAFEIVGRHAAGVLLSARGSVLDARGPSTRQDRARWPRAGRLLFNRPQRVLRPGTAGPGSTIGGAERENNVLLNQIVDKGDAVRSSNTHVVLTPILDHIFGNARPALLALMGAVVVMLLVTCINVAGLSLARGASRMREMAVRAAIGAGRRALMRQLMAESAMVAVVADVDRRRCRRRSRSKRSSG